MSSLLSATYVVPWPPFYETLLKTVGSVNVDIGWLRQPLNAVMAWIGDAAKDWSCNFSDMSATELFMYHFGLLGLIAVSTLVAWVIALGLHRVNVCTKSFGPTFRREMASATAIKTFSFFVFLLPV